MRKKLDFGGEGGNPRAPLLIMQPLSVVCRILLIVIME